jgi:hypothetical protein
MAVMSMCIGTQNLWLHAAEQQTPAEGGDV